MTNFYDDKFEACKRELEIARNALKCSGSGVLLGSEIRDEKLKDEKLKDEELKDEKLNYEKLKDEK